MAVQWDKENGLNGWGVDFWNTIRGIKKDLPEVDTEIKKFIEKKSELFEGINAQDIELLRPDTIQSVEELSDVTDELREDFVDFLSTADLSGNIMKQYQNHLAKSAEKTSRFSSFTKKAGGVLKSFCAGLASMGINMGVGIVLEGVATAIDNVANSVEYAEKRANEFTNTVKSQKEEFNQNTSKIAELNGQYQMLSKGVSNVGENISLTTDEYITYKDIVSQISDIMPGLNTYYNDQGEKIGFVTGKLKDLNKEYDEHKMKESQKLVNGEGEDGVSLSDVIESYNDQKDIGFWTKELNNTISFFTGNGYDDKYSNDELLGALKELRNLSKEEVASKLGNSKSIPEHIRKLLTVGLAEPANPITDEMRALQDILGYDATDIMDMDNVAYESFKEKLEAIIDSYQNKVDSATNNLSEGLQEVAGSKQEYYDLGDKKKYVDALLSNVSYDIVDDIGITNEDGEATEDSIRQFVNRIIKAVKENKDGINDSFNDLFSINLDDDSINITDAYEKASKCIDGIAKALGYDEEGKKYLKIVFGYESIENQYNDYTKKLNDAFGSTATVNFPESDKVTSKVFQTDTRDADLSDWAKNNNVTLAEIEQIKQAGYNAKSSIDELNSALDDLRNNSDNSSFNTKSFNSVWKSIGTMGTDEEKKEALEAKEKLEELAEAGKLTVKAFKDFDIADQLLKDTGLSAEQATRKINGLVDETKQLSALRTGITAITSAYDEKKESKHKVVSSSTLDSMGDTLGVLKWNEKDLKVWENYKSVAADGTKNTKELKEAQDKLATSYVNSNNFLANLTSTNADYYEGLLKEMGVTNAHEIITDKVGKQQKNLSVVKKELGIASDDLKNASVSEIAALYDVDTASKEASRAMYDLISSKVAAGNVTISTSADCNNLLRMAEAAGIAANKVRSLLNAQIEFGLSERQTKDADTLQNAINGTSGNGKVSYVDSNGNVKTSSSKEKAMGRLSHLRRMAKENSSKAQKNVDKWNKKHNDDVKVSLSRGNRSNDNSKKSGKGDKSSKTSKNTKQEMNWLERRLTRMQSIIDLTASKLQNLFSVKAKNNNLDKQIKQTTKLMKQYGVAAKRYQTKADSVAKGSTKKIKSGKNKGKKKKVKPLSKSIIKKIQSGELTKAKAKKLFKNYNQSYYDRISSYIDYYDKAQDAKKNQQDTRAKIRELEIDKQKNIQDDADKKIEKYQTQRENTLLKDKNNTIKAQIDATKQSYDAQIRIAQIERDTETEAKLRADKIKAINDLYQEEIDNIKANADAKIKLLETGIIDKNGNRKSYGQQYYRDQVSLTEARGAIVDKQWYRIQSDIEDDKIKEAQTERNQLIAELGNFDEGTQGWYNIQSDISDCEHTINEAKIAQIENTKAMRSITEAMEEKYGQWYSNFNSELSFLSSLQSGDHADSDTGTFTDSGNLGIYTQALTFKSANAEKDYWRDKTTALQGLIDKKASIEKIKDAGFEFESIEDAEKALDDYYQKWQDAISTEKSAEEAIVDLMKEKYEAQKDYLQDIIDAKKEALDIEKDLFDYQQNIADKTKNVATLQKQINALRGDTSEEGRARLAKLQVSLDEAQQDLKNAEFERYVSEQQNMLDNMMKQYDDLLTRLLKETDKILADGLKYVGDNIISLSSLLSTTASTYDYTLTTKLNTVNSSLATGATTIGTKIDTSGKTTEEIRNAIKGIKGDDPSSVVGLLQSLPGKIIEEYKNKDGKTSGNGDKTGGGSNGGGSNSGNGNTVAGENSSYMNTNPGTPYENSVKHTDGITKWGNEKSLLGKSWEDSLKGWLKDQATGKKKAKVKKKDKSKYNEMGSELNKKLVKNFGYYLSDLNGGLNALAEWLNINTNDKNWSESGNVYKELKELGCFSTGGIAHIVKSNGEDGLMMARNGEGFVAPEHVESIQKLLSITPDMTKFTAELLKRPKIQPNNQTTSNSIGEVNFHMDINPENFPDFVDQLQNSQRVRQIFSVAVNDLVKNGKITSNIQRY